MLEACGVLCNLRERCFSVGSDLAQLRVCRISLQTVVTHMRRLLTSRPAVTCPCPPLSIRICSAMEVCMVADQAMCSCVEGREGGGIRGGESREGA